MKDARCRGRGVAASSVDKELLVGRDQVGAAVLVITAPSPNILSSSMRVLLQRVSEAKVTIDDRVVGEIGSGLLIFLGIAPTDTDEDIVSLVGKIVHLRVFENEQGKLDKSLLDISGQALVISQFTLYASCSKGRRPDFLDAAKPDIAIPLYKKFVQKFRETGLSVAEGEFGAFMKVSLANTGPFTIWLDTQTT